jgi:LemA protein
MPLLIAVVVLAVIALIVIMLYNRLVAIRNQTSNAWKQIDVQLKRRHDLIPNLVEVVKDYMSYEQDPAAGDRARNQAVKARRRRRPPCRPRTRSRAPWASCSR